MAAFPHFSPIFPTYSNFSPLIPTFPHFFQLFATFRHFSPLFTTFRGYTQYLPTGKYTNSSLIIPLMYLDANAKHYGRHMVTIMYINHAPNFTIDSILILLLFTFP